MAFLISRACRVNLIPVLAALLGLALGACESTKPKIEENRFPTDYKTPILDNIRSQLTDPTGIRDAFIAEPALKQHAGATRYVACLRFNPRDHNGQYQGNKEMAAFYYDGQLTQIVDADRALCGGAAYQPFPEMQKLCRSLQCQR